MPLVYVTRRMHFSAGHRLHAESLDEETNREIYGACNNPLGHGHNYDLEVTVVGEPDPVTGMVMDIKALKDLIQKEVIDPMDHKFLNVEVPFLARQVPTAENIVVAIWRVLQDKLSGVKLYRLKLYETERNIVEYYGA
ncbi:MAG TPA: 6-carboxytetrahydropterin synthase [bacterium]|nr:6-carboxytetrahydropterin synthase [bacterium]HPN36060.1 6-carboxytetrahydropterin synthase [bacterium]